MRNELLALMQATTGHVVYESGHHGNVWLDLDRLWASPSALTPFLSNLARDLPIQAIDVICGPMTGGVFVALAIATELGLPFCYTEHLANLAPEARYWVGQTSGHYVQQDQPELVVEAIRQVLTGVRQSDTWTSLETCCAS